MEEFGKALLALTPLLLCLVVIGFGGLEAAGGRPAPMMTAWHRLWRKQPAAAADWRLHGATLVLSGVLGLLVIALVAMTRTDLAPPAPVAQPMAIGLWLAQMAVAALLMLTVRRIRYQPIEASRHRASID